MLNKRDYTISDKNNEAINIFMGMYRDETKKIFCDFLFHMMAYFASNEGSSEDQYTHDCINQFIMLHDLVSGLEDNEIITMKYINESLKSTNN